MKSNLFGLGTIALTAGLVGSLLTVAGCKSAGSGSDSAASNSATSTGVPVVIVATPTPQPLPTPIAVTSCTDADGAVHLNGQSWQLASSTVPAYACPNSNELYVPMQVTATNTCVLGVTVQSGDALITSRSTNNGCVSPELSATAQSAFVSEGSSATVDVALANLTSPTYSCTNTEDGSAAASGSVDTSTGKFSVSMSKDIKCIVSATAVTGITESVESDVSVNCGNKLKVGGHCEDFVCQSFIAISADSTGTIQAPARTTAGVCFAIKLMSAISNSASSLTTTIETDMISRNHDVSYQDPSNVHNPYLMGHGHVSVQLQGARTLKLAGSGDSLSPILVDNFVVTGIYPTSIASPAVSYFHAYGTSDSTVRDTGGILYNNFVVPLVPFASGGTSTIAPLDITSQIDTTQSYDVDVKALDAGGSRQLSDLYLVFQ